MDRWRMWGLRRSLMNWLRVARRSFFTSGRLGVRHPNRWIKSSHTFQLIFHMFTSLGWSSFIDAIISRFFAICCNFSFCGIISCHFIWGRGSFSFNLSFLWIFFIRLQFWLAFIFRPTWFRYSLHPRFNLHCLTIYIDFFFHNFFGWLVIIQKINGDWRIRLRLLFLFFYILN